MALRNLMWNWFWVQVNITGWKVGGKAKNLLVLIWFTMWLHRALPVGLDNAWADEQWMCEMMRLFQGMLSLRQQNTESLLDYLQSAARLMAQFGSIEDTVLSQGWCSSLTRPDDMTRFHQVGCFCRTQVLAGRCGHSSDQFGNVRDPGVKNDIWAVENLSY